MRTALNRKVARQAANIYYNYAGGGIGSLNMETELAEIAGIMRQSHHLDVTPYDSDFLRRTLHKMREVAGVKRTADYGALLRQNPAEAKKFYNSLSISYSEFFRNPLTFALLEQFILPSLLEKKAGSSELRVWSVGCAAGQEAYSLAMLLDGLCTRRDGRRNNFRIFATDFSEPELAAARAGVYEPAALKNVRLEHLRKYFMERGGYYEVNSKIKELVEFSAYDLLACGSVCPPAAIYGDFDLVSCSNLLFYYRPEIRQGMLEKIHSCLSAQGCLVTGEAEREIIGKCRGFRPVFSPAPVFQKL